MASRPRAAETATDAPTLLGKTLERVAAIFDSSRSPVRFSARIEITEAEGYFTPLKGQTLELALSGPDRLWIQGRINQVEYQLGRDRQTLWIANLQKQFGLLGNPETPRFASRPGAADGTRMGPLALPIPAEQLSLAPLLLRSRSLPDVRVDGEACHVIEGSLAPEAQALIKLPPFSITLAVRKSDSLPLRITYHDSSEGARITGVIHQPRFDATFPDSRWALPKGVRIQKVALSHLLRFIAASGDAFAPDDAGPGPATSERRRISAHGEGRLEDHNGTRILFLKGTPLEMGEQHGKLLRRPLKEFVQRVLYGVGVGRSLELGRWYFGDLELWESKTRAFTDASRLGEMTAIAQAAGLAPEEVRLSNLFPELFQSPTFALTGGAHSEGRLLHGSVLRYARGIGFESHPLVTVRQPTEGHAWIQIGYPGWVGGLAGMNSKQLTIAHAGGKTPQSWDAEATTQCLRDVMEKASTLEEAVELLRKSPGKAYHRCIVTDGKTGKAAGIVATSGRFEIVDPGKSHPAFPGTARDAIVFHSTSKNEAFVSRIQAGHGKFTDETARGLLNLVGDSDTRLQSVLFSPTTLDLWVANMDGRTDGPKARYTRLNLKDLLNSPPRSTKH